MMKARLTAPQEETLACIKKLTDARGIAPTYQEIADELGISVNAVFERVRWIEKKGYVSQIPGASRSLRLVDTEPAAERTAERKNPWPMA